MSLYCLCRTPRPGLLNSPSPPVDSFHEFPAYKPGNVVQNQLDYSTFSKYAPPTEFKEYLAHVRQNKTATTISPIDSIDIGFDRDDNHLRPGPILTENQVGYSS